MTGVLLAVQVRQAAADQPKVRIVICEWRPYTSASLPGRGVLSEMAEIAFRIQGVEAVFSVVPWPSAVSMIQNGEADALLPVYPSERNKTHYYLSEPLLAVDSVFVRLRSYNLAYNTVQDITKYRIGTVQDSPYAASLAKQGAFFVEEAPDESLNYKKLVAGKIDIMLDTRETTERMLEAMPLQERADVVYMEPPYYTKTLHMAFTPDARGQAWCAVFNEGLKQLQERGVYAAILEKHHISRSTGIPDRLLD